MMKSPILVLCIFLALQFPKSRSASPKVVCYMANWSRYRPSPMAYLPENIPAKDCDVLVYAYLIVNASTWKLESRDRVADYKTDGFRNTGDLKSISPGIKLVFAVGGYDNSQGIEPVKLYSDMMASSENRQVFVKSARSFLVSKGFDGLELHWYYPGANDKENYVKLIKELSREFSRHNLEVYARVPYYNDHIEEGFNVAEISKYLTALHVSTVDMIVYSGKNATDNSSPLRRRSFDMPGSNQYDQNVESVLNSYIRRGAPKEKLIFGVSTSGHSFILQDVKVNGLDSPIKGRDASRERYSNETGIFFYYEICANIQSGKWLSRRDPKSRIPYAYNPSTGQWVSYDDQDTITEKARFAKSSGYGGIFLWLLDQDDFRGLCGEKHGLLRTLVRELKGPDHTGDNKSVQTETTSTTTVATTIVDPTISTAETTVAYSTTTEEGNINNNPPPIGFEKAKDILLKVYANITRNPFGDTVRVYSRNNNKNRNIF